MKENIIRKLLKEKNLRFTNVRNDILIIFENRNYALSYNDLEKELESKFDMATIYRTLNKFVECNIIHQIPLESKIAYYALNDILHANGDSKKQHIHFICKDCKHTFCLDDVTLKDLKIKKNFRLESLKIIAEGICDTCSMKY